MTSYRRRHQWAARWNGRLDEPREHEDAAAEERAQRRAPVRAGAGALRAASARAASSASVAGCPERGQHVFVAAVAIERALAEESGGVEPRRLEVAAPRSARAARRPRARRQLASRAWRHESRSSRTFTQICHALEAVLAAIDAEERRRALVPRRRRRLRTEAERVRGDRARARGSLPRREPRPRRPRQDRQRRLRRRGGGRGAVDDERARAGHARRSSSSSPRGAGRGCPALPRQPARSDLGLRAERGRGESELCGDLRPTRARRAQPRRARESPPARGALHGGQAPAGTELALGRERLLLNPGSVGQPRDGDRRAAWLEIDKAAGWARFCRTDYPVEQTQAEMRELGLPEALAARLSYGV